MADKTIEIIGPPYNEPAGQGETGPAGGQGPTGDGAKSHYNGDNCSWVCDAQPQAGKQGLAPANAGGTGYKGLKGNTSSSTILKLGLVIGTTTIVVSGGVGQKGGKGGTGGIGGPGGNPGSTVAGCGSNTTVGPQGPGGKGGDGGDGGDCGFVTIYYDSSAGGNISIKPIDNRGAPGDPGDPGPGNGNQGPGSQGKNWGNQGQAPQYKINDTAG